MKYSNSIAYKPVNAALSKICGHFTIVGRCLSGSRHYSESLCVGEVAEEFDKYVAVVNYFGGGTVEVYHEETGDLVRSTVVMDFDF